VGLPYGDQGLLVPRHLLDAVGGVPDVPLMEDVILARRLRGRIRPLNADARTSATRFESEGWTTRVVRNLWTLARFQMGVSPERLAREYHRKSND
ncbi:MAG: glycosyl transferase, partial [Boseongicola sp.]